MSTKAKDGDVYPDATAHDPSGALVWIEVERSIKQDYGKTIISRYKAQKSGRLAAVHIH